MKKKDLKKLSRLDLLELLYEQSKQIDNLKAELEETKNQLNQKEIMINNAGSIADAVLQLNNIFAIAQETANQYVNSVKKVYNNPNIVETRIQKDTNEYLFSLVDNSSNNQQCSLSINNDEFDKQLLSQSLKTFDYDLKDKDITNWDWDVD